MKGIMSFLPQTREELHNTITHLVGAISAAALTGILVIMARPHGWQWTTGVICMGIGTLLMYSFSTSYHWTHQGKAKRIMRILDHIGIYIMIASSYTPICIGVVGGWLGWTLFAIQWGVVICGSVYKITALGKYPRLSLFLYLLMGWSVVFVSKPVLEHLPISAIAMIVVEGFFYTAGTWFFVRDNRHYYHAIWHIFVLLGTISHWTAIMITLTELGK